MKIKCGKLDSNTNESYDIWTSKERRIRSIFSQCRLCFDLVSKPIKLVCQVWGHRKRHSGAVTISLVSTTSADAARVSGRSVRQPHVVPSGRGGRVRLHQPPPRLEAPPGQRLHHTHPLHYHEGKLYTNCRPLQCELFERCVKDVSHTSHLSLSVLDVCCGYHHACSLRGLHASFSNWWIF